jgi:hypothetical protein
MSHEAEVRRGQMAQEVLDNEEYIKAHAAIDAELIRQWREARNIDDREQLHQLLLMHGKAKAALEAVMRSGELAAGELQRRHGRAEEMAKFSRRAA